MNELFNKALYRLKEAENGFLLQCGWVPADPFNLNGDWLHPKDRTNIWDKIKALEVTVRRVDEGTWLT